MCIVPAIHNKVFMTYKVTIPSEKPHTNITKFSIIIYLLGINLTSFSNTCVTFFSF